MSDRDLRDPLEDCMETVHRLEEENEQLRQSAGAFGQLAERLNRALQEERRTGAERRVNIGPAPDRRTPS
jgi:cell division septum initiation protein DivIVA